jgi:ComF family protein
MRALLDLLFPPRCPGCRELVASAAPFCARCLETLAEVPLACCPLCGEPEEREVCERCRAWPPSFERARAPYLHGGALADAIHRLKYEDRPHLARPLSALVATRLAPELDWCEIVAPVALHENRLRKRGYDQALLLARELGERAHKRVVARAVKRVRDTPPQVGRDRAQRVANVQGAFAADAREVAGRRVLLVDDVLTTGATAQAAAKALVDAGARAVRVVALARAG